MDHKIVGKLEREIEKAVAGVVVRLGLRKLSLLPSQKVMQRMAKAAVASPTTGPARKTQVVVRLKTEPFRKSLKRSK